MCTMDYSKFIVSNQKEESIGIQRVNRFLFSCMHSPRIRTTVKPVLRGHSKIDKTKIWMTNGSLMKVKSIAECSPWSILQYFWPALSDNHFWKPFFGLF